MVVKQILVALSNIIIIIIIIIIIKNNNNNNNNDDDDDDFISKALFHVKLAQLRCTMPMNNTRARARRSSKTSDKRTIAYKSLKHNTIC